jgi:NitT/TauT family transport system permease protein
VWRFFKTRRGAGLCSLVAFFLGWQYLIPLIPTRLIPTPLGTLTFMWNELRLDSIGLYNVYESFGTSLGRLALGFLIALAVGIPIGLLMGASKVLENAMHDFVVVGLAMPGLVWGLLLGMWLGLGSAPPILAATLTAVPFVIFNTLEGVKNVPTDLTEMATSYGVSRGRVIRHVVVPSLMPFFFAAMRYGIANGWKGLVLTEVFSSTKGAGWMIRYWEEAQMPAGVFGYAAFFMLFALVLERLVFQRFAGRVFRWRPEVHMDIPEAALNVEKPAAEEAKEQAKG